MTAPNGLGTHMQNFTTGRSSIFKLLITSIRSDVETKIGKKKPKHSYKIKCENKIKILKTKGKKKKKKKKMEIWWISTYLSWN